MATAHIDESIDIRAPIGRVFTGITDPRRIPEWNPGIVEIKNFTGSPIQVGTAWRQTLVIAGRATELDCRIVQLDPPREGVLEVSGKYQGLIHTWCQDLGGTTRVTQSLEFMLPGGLLGAVARKAAEPAIRREVRDTMQRQKAALEAEQAATGGP